MCYQIFTTDGGPDLDTVADLLQIGWTMEQIAPYMADDGPGGIDPAAYCFCSVDIEQLIEDHTGSPPEWDECGGRCPTLPLIRTQETQP